MAGALTFVTVQTLVLFLGFLVLRYCEAMRVCAYNDCYVGICQNERPCEKHGELKCWCGQMAVRNCGIAVTFVCGQPLCKAHSCNQTGYGLTGHGHHSREGQEQYRQFKATETGKKGGRTKA